MGSFRQMTIHGYPLMEVVSALQKAIRRGDEQGALYWAAEMSRSGYGKYLWKRLKIILSEDIGLGEPTLPATFRALYENWKDFNDDDGGYVELPIAHCVMLMARARKSHAQLYGCEWAFRHADKRERMPIPDIAYDVHTSKGRNMGRGPDHFMQVSGKLENEDTSYDDPEMKAAWEEVVRARYKMENLGPLKNPPVNRPIGKKQADQVGKPVTPSLFGDE